MKSELTHVIFLLFEICVCDADIETVSVIGGDSVTLHTDVTEIQSSDVIEWRRLNGSRIARISGDSIKTDGASRDGLQLDKPTGDLTITSIKTTDSGEYILKIKNSRGSSEKTFSVSAVSGDEVKSVSLTVGDSVSLNSGTNIQRDDVIEWRFGDLNSLIAENNRKTEIFSTYDGPDGRFRHRLKLDNQTGSLTITHTSTKHSGLYEAGIRKSSSRHTIHKSYSVTAGGEMTSAISVKKGESVTLLTDLTEIQTEDLMQWMLGDTVLAEINQAQNRFLIYDGPDERFRDRLKLDHQTRSLTITDIRFTDSGLYKLKISSSRFIINRRITVTVIGEMTSALSVIEGGSVTLHTDLTEMQTDDFMQWMFGDTLLAEINQAGDSFSTSDGPDGSFRGRLKLDPQTRSLIIMNTRYTDSGLYELKISSSRFIINKRITLTVIDPGLSPGAKAGIVVAVLLAFAVVAGAAVVIYQCHKISELIAKASSTLAVMEGETVPLIPRGIEIPKDEDIQWKFGGAVIAERKRLNGEITIHDDVLDKKFKGRLQLNKDFGYLTIMNITTTDSGQTYELWSGRSGMKPLKTFYVSVYDKTDIVKVPVKKGGSVKLETGVPDIQKVEQIQWKFRLYDSPIAQITGGTRTTSPFFTGWWRFMCRLKLDQDGSLTISRIELNHTGFYVLYITADGETTMKLFNVKVDLTDESWINLIYNRKKPEEKSVRINKPENVPLNSVL